MSSGPVDPRLLRYASASRRFFIAGAFVAIVQTLAMVGSAWFATQLIVAIVEGRALSALGLSLACFAASVLIRAASVWVLDLVSARGGAHVTSQLRMKAIDSIQLLGPQWVANHNSARITATISQGLDSLDGYFSKYLPQLVLTVIATPITVGFLLMLDLSTGIVVILTLPIIPIFMVLIGWATRAIQQQQWQSLTRLSSGFLDVVEGLSTLTIFGRQHRQRSRIEGVTEEYRSRTMKVLRVSFLSSFVLELVGSLSVALVAVSIGVRLVDGNLGLTVGLFALLLAPEAYLPLRAVGAQFHAAADGVAAAESVFEILDEAAEVPEVPEVPTPETAADGSAPAGTLGAGHVLHLSALSAGYGDRTVVSSLTATFRPGELTVIAGPSGTGKTTLVAALLGFIPSTGTLRYGDEFVDGASLRAYISWVGQKPSLVAGTVAENVALGARTIDPELLGEALRLASASTLAAEQRLGVNGSGLSVGQAHRVAIARAFYRALGHRTPVILLDEPSAALDEATEHALITGLEHLKTLGYIVIVVSHRDAFLAAADSVVDLAVVDLSTVQEVLS